MAGQANHFNMYAPQFNPPGSSPGQARYSNEVNRLFGVLNSAWPTGSPWPATTRRRHGDLAVGRGLQELRPRLEDFPDLQKWFEESASVPS